MEKIVAPFVGAWIEIINTYEEVLEWLNVAPFVGAWIEIGESAILT